MSSRFVRASRFRHVYAEPAKPELQYTDLDLSPVTGDHNYIKGNGKYFVVAVRGGGGPVQVIPYTQTGKLPRGYPTLNGHSAAVYDTAWNPFNDNVLATGSDDTTVKVWNVPDGGLTENMKEASQTLSGHGKPVALLQWHPTASNVLASVGKDPCIKIWDVEKGVAKSTLEGYGGLVQDLSFNYDGSQLISSCKDKSAKIHEPRSGSVVAEWAPHEGSKAFKTLFLGSRGQVLTVGFTKQSKREFKVWDARNLAEPMAIQEIDQAAGVMMPFYDDDTRMLYLTGKGDGNIRYYEFVDEAPFVYFLAEHRTNVSTKGADMLPKLSCNVLKCEVARFLKLTGDSVEPISFIVPRKSEAFQEDIFPDTNASTPATTADAWFGGADVPPKKVSLDPSKGRTAYASTAKPATPSPAITPGASAGAGAVGPTGGASSAKPASVDKPVVEKAATVEVASDKPSSADKATISALESEVSTLKKQLAEAQERIAALELSETKLKKAVAALSA